MIDTFAAVRELKGPRLVHVITQKGKGFPAGERSAREVARAAARPRSGDRRASASRRRASATRRSSATRLAELGTEHKDLVAITAAMPSGTGTDAFAKAHPERFFDVGIAEGHAVTFAAGLATRGVRPVVAIYSTFLQRAYDNIIHDVAIQSLPVIFCMDRAGLVGEDGETHMGLYDIAYMLAVPDMTVTAPKDARRDARAAAHGHRAPRRAVRAPLSARQRAGHAAPRSRDRAGAVRHVGSAAPGRRRRDSRRRHDGPAVARRRAIARGRWARTSPS